MNIQTLNKLVSEKYPTGRAWVSHSTDQAGRNKSTRFVSVVFADGGKVYQYSQTIEAVADRLELSAPAIDYDAAARRVGAGLASGESPIDYYSVSTVREWYQSIIPAGMTVKATEMGVDEYGRPLYRHEIAVNRWL